MRKPKPETASAGGSRVLLAARLATGAGKHGGSKRAQRRSDRQATKRALRRGEHG